MRITKHVCVVVRSVSSAAPYVVMLLLPLFTSQARNTGHSCLDFDMADEPVPPVLGIEPDALPEDAGAALAVLLQCSEHSWGHVTSCGSPRISRALGGPRWKS